MDEGFLFLFRILNVGQNMSRFFKKIQNILLCIGGIWGILNIGKNFPFLHRG